MNQDRLICLFLGLTLLCGGVRAQDVSSTLTDDLATLDVTTVYSTEITEGSVASRVKRQAEIQQIEMPLIDSKTPQKKTTVLPFVDTISGAELKQYQRFELEDSLRQSAGVSVVQTGQRGSQTSLFIRGMESNHAVVLLNGRRLPGGLAGLYQIEFLDTATLESVQLTPRSGEFALWDRMPFLEQSICARRMRAMWRPIPWRPISKRALSTRFGLVKN